MNLSSKFWLRTLVPSAVGLFVLAGIFLVRSDLQSIVYQKRLSIEQTGVAASNLLESAPVRSVLDTKNSQTEADSQLQERLFELKSDLDIRGEIGLIDYRSQEPRWLISTDKDVRKGDLVAASPSLSQAKLDNSPKSTDLTKDSEGRWIRSFSPLKSNAEIFVGIRSNESPLHIQLIEYILHYILLFILFIALAAGFVIGAIKRSRANLLKFQEQFQTLFQEATDGVLLLNDQGEILQANTNATRLLKREAKDLMGQPLTANQDQSLHFIPLDPQNESIEKTLKSGKKFRSKAKVILENEETRYLSYSCSPIVENSSIRGALIIFQDISVEMVREQELQLRHIKLTRANRELREQIISDPLTGCLNKEYFKYYMGDQNLELLKIEGCALLLIDIDDFKMINDSQGHQRGDKVLQDLGAFFLEFFRKSDKVIRYGGDEFAVFMPRSDLKTASTVGGNLIKALDQTKIPSLQSVTISIGVADLKTFGDSDEWFERADKALYDAKGSGKNTVSCSSSEELEILA